MYARAVREGCGTVELRSGDHSAKVAFKSTGVATRLGGAACINRDYRRGGRWSLDKERKQIAPLLRMLCKTSHSGRANVLKGRRF